MGRSTGLLYLGLIWVACICPVVTAETVNSRTVNGGTVNAGTINIVSRGDDNANYAIQMIELGLQKAQVPLELNVTNAALSAPKLREDLLAGTIDIIWTATNNDMEQNAIAVRVPLFKGLLGHRILIIHGENQHLFDHITEFEQIKSF